MSEGIGGAAQMCGLCVKSLWAHACGAARQECRTAC